MLCCFCPSCTEQIGVKQETINTSARFFPQLFPTTGPAKKLGQKEKSIQPNVFIFSRAKKKPRSDQQFPSGKETEDLFFKNEHYDLAHQLVIIGLLFMGTQSVSSFILSHRWPVFLILLFTIRYFPRENAPNFQDIKLYFAYMYCVCL